MTAGAGRRGILLVDDDTLDVELTLEAFAEIGLRESIRVVRSGAEAIDILLSAGTSSPGDGTPQLPELVLLDLKMPATDGFEVLRRVKAGPGVCRTPVVVLTSSREISDLVECYDLGANSYLVKPVAYSGFLEVVRQIHAYWLTLNASPPAPAMAATDARRQRSPHHPVGDLDDRDVVR